MVSLGSGISFGHSGKNNTIPQLKLIGYGRNTPRIGNGIIKKVNLSTYTKTITTTHTTHTKHISSSSVDSVLNNGIITEGKNVSNLNVILDILSAHIPEHHDIINAFRTLYFYFMSIYGQYIFNRNKFLPGGTSNGSNHYKNSTINTTLAFEMDTIAQFLHIQTTMRTHLHKQQTIPGYLSTNTIKVILTFINDSIQNIIHNISVPAKYINSDIKTIMEQYKQPKIHKKSKYLNYEALNKLGISITPTNN